MLMKTHLNSGCLLFAVLIFTAWLFSALPVWSKSDTDTAAKFVSIPVYYLTDRNLEGETYGHHRRYHAFCKHDMYYGTTYVVVPNTAKKTDKDMMARLGWKEQDKKPPKIAVKERIDPGDAVKAKKEFFERLAEALAKSKQTDLCVYVHGACDAFEDSSQDAALMAYYMEKPLVLYSWPSTPRWRAYFIDGVNSEWSQGHFNTFCKDLLSFQSTVPGMHAVFLSHSMGNRLVIRSLPVVYGKGLVSEWELMSPDIDAATCRHYIMDITPDNSKIRLYVSNRDKMLPFSQILAGGYYRLGEAANEVVAGPAVKKMAPGQMERIDFTVLDTGFTGHTIPCELVSNIFHNNEPGAHLVLVPETQVKGNRLVRFANRSEKLDDTTGGLPPELCKRVMKVK